MRRATSVDDRSRLIPSLVAAAVASVSLWIVLPSGPSGAQVSNEPAELVSRQPGGEPWSPSNSAASISANGAIVAFDSAPTRVPVVAIRDRLANTTVQVPVGNSVRPAVSDDGCVIAYSSGGTLYALNRCTNTNVQVAAGLATFLNRPAVSANGAVIAIALGNRVIVYERVGANYVQAAVFNPERNVFDATVSISDDGNLVAFAAQPLATIAVFPMSVYTWNWRTGAVDLISRNAGGQAAPGTSIEASISGDGRLVAFTSDSPGLLAPPGSPGQDVYVFDRSTGQMRMIAGTARFPAMSRDGRHVAVNQITGEVGEVFVVRSTSANPFEATAVDLVSYSLAGPPNTTGGAATRPAISETGRWVAFDSYAGNLLTTDVRFHQGFHVYVRERPPVLGIAPVDFGQVNVGSSADRPTTITNTGLSNWITTSAETTPGFSLVSSNCPLAIPPGASCQATVRFSPGVGGAVAGTLTLRDGSYPARQLVATGGLRGTGVVQPGVTTTAPPGTPTTPTTTTTLPPPPPGSTFSLSADPPLVEFPLSPVGVPTEAREVTIRNTGTAPNAIDELLLEGEHAEDFSIATSDCPEAVLAPDATCTVAVVWTPRDSDDRVGALRVTGQGGSSAVSFLRGEAFYQPQILPEPPVASPGQVVTLVGVGFPPLSTVQITWEVDEQVFSVQADELGSFRQPAIVFGSRGFGDRAVDSPAVEGSYAPVEAVLLVAPGTMQPQSVTTIIRGAASHLTR